MRPIGKPTNGVAKALTRPAVAAPPNVENIKGTVSAMTLAATPERANAIIKMTATMAIKKGIRIPLSKH